MKLSALVLLLNYSMKTIDKNTLLFRRQISDRFTIRSQTIWSVFSNYLSVFTIGECNYLAQAILFLSDFDLLGT